MPDRTTSPPELSAEQADATIRSGQYVRLLVVVAVIGVLVAIGAAIAAVLRLPLSAVVIATLLTTHAGNGVEPLIIAGVVVSYIAALLLSPGTDLTGETPASPTPEPVPVATALLAPAPTS